MVVRRAVKKVLRGLLADTKPTSGYDTPTTRQRFLETDTGIEYEWSGSAWKIISPIQFLTAFLSTVNTAGVFYLGLGDIAANGGEGDAQWTVPQDIYILELQAVVKTNAHTAAITFRLRDDAANVTGAVITPTTGQTGLLTSGAIKVKIAGGSKISILIDTTGAGTQNLNAYFIVSFVNGIQT
jgi:hypothetical protein